MRIVGNGGLSDEAAFHDRFARHSVRGEWFRLEGDLAELVSEAKPMPSHIGEGGGAGRPPDKRSAAQQWLLDTLADGPLSASEIYRAGVAEGHTRKTIRNAATELGVVRDPPGGGRRCKWGLPPATSPQNDE